MERVSFKYEYSDKTGQVKEVKLEKSADEEGVLLDDICEMFEDFLKASGYSFDYVMKYFTGV